LPRLRHYPCQICLPQAHCTVSVGTLFVSCCLQTGQGLVITYVITLHLPSIRNRLSLCTSCTKRVVTLQCARQAWEVPEVAVRVSFGCARFCQHQCHFSFIDLPNVSRVVRRPSFLPSRERAAKKHRTDCSPLSGCVPFGSSETYSNCCSADFLDHLPKVPPSHQLRPSPTTKRTSSLMA
jgi:hypothetical protein